MKAIGHQSRYGRMGGGGRNNRVRSSVDGVMNAGPGPREPSRWRENASRGRMFPWHLYVCYIRTYLRMQQVVM